MEANPTHLSTSVRLPWIDHYPWTGQLSITMEQHELDSNAGKQLS